MGNAKVRVACIGAGAWGMNLVRTFGSLSTVELVACCDKRKERLDLVQGSFPSVKMTLEFQEIVDDEKVEAVVSAANAQWHHPIAKAALERG